MENYDVLNNSTDFYIKICDSLSPEIRLEIIEGLMNKSCETCTNGSCRVASYEKIELDKNGNPEGYACVGWYNSLIIGKSKALEENDVYKLIYSQKK